MNEYLSILILVLVSIMISSALILLPRFFTTRNISVDSNKLSTYECGFIPLIRARNNFDVKFYLISILFIIFDLEIIFLFPWAISLFEIKFYGFWSMIIFLTILGIGFIYECCKGALD